MATAYALTRPQLDRLAVESAGRVRLGCIEHPDSSTVALYQDGCVRVLCGHCGFEGARVKVAGTEEHASNELLDRPTTNPKGGRS